jgi:hypothetical protein
MEYKSPENPFHINGDGSITSDGDKVNKISGTAMAGILGCSPWSTPFTVACHLLALGREDISNKASVKRGQALEGKIIRYAGETYPHIGQFQEAEAIFAKREGDHDAWESDFEDDVFAGHVDGIVTDADGNDYILEVKTSANLESWEDGVPEYYFWQVALYDYFITKKGKAYVLLGIANENTDRDPASWIPNEENTFLFTLDIDQEKVERTIAALRDWYATYILNHTTPIPDLDKTPDKMMLEHLTNISQSIGDVQTTLDEYFDLGLKIDQHNDAIAELLIRQQQLKDSIRDYMIHNNLSSLNSASGNVKGVITIRTNTKISEEKMVADGIDPIKYKTESISKAFTVKQNKIKEVKE